MDAIGAAREELDAMLIRAAVHIPETSDVRTETVQLWREQTLAAADALALAVVNELMWAMQFGRGIENRRLLQVRMENVADALRARFTASPAARPAGGAGAPS